MSLRAVAAELEEQEDRSAIGKLVAQLDDEQRADVNDLLFGEPLIGHTIAAKVLNKEFGEMLVRTVTDKMVQEYRTKSR